ncbi:MAG: hypothetical protein IJT64_01820, partial [Kiritimatiellae bacterium]|nr:hypothetical protein [Kiritimatiellia bacterium]
LRTARRYYARFVGENTAGQEEGYGEVFTFDTAESGNATSAAVAVAGLRQVYVNDGVGGSSNFDVFDPDDDRWATEVVPGAVMARYSSQGNGGIGNGAGEKKVYTAPSGNTYSWATKLNSTFYYDGYMRVEAGHTYNFFEFEYDLARIDVDGTTIIRNTDYTSAGTGSYVATSTGWVTIKVWLGGVSGNTGCGNGYNFGVGWNEDGTTTAVSSCEGWNLIENVEGEPPRFCVEPARVPTIVSASVSAGTATVEAIIPQGGFESDTYLVWGATDLGDEAALTDWANASDPVHIVADETTNTFSEAINTAATPFVRVAVVDASGTWWSAPVLLGSATDPIIGTVTGEADGDTLAVEGVIISEGSGLALDVELLVSYDADFAVAETNFVTLAADDSFAVEADLVPGTNGWWKVVARTSDGGYDATLPAAFETKAGSVLHDGATATVSHHTATITAVLDVLGAGTTMAYVWAGSDPSDLAQVAGSAKELVNTGTFTITATFPGDPHEVYYKIVTVNTAPGGTEWTSETSVSATPLMTLDAGTYTWKSDVAAGDWNDPANWTVTGVDASDCLGYPDSASASVRFVAGTTARIAVGGAFTFKDMSLKYANIDLTFAGTNSESCTLAGDIQNVANDQNDGTLVPNARVVFSAVTVTDSGAFNWATKFSTNCVLRLENKATLSLDGYMHVFGTNTWVEVVEGSTMVWRRLASDQTGFDFCNFAGGLVVDDATFNTSWLTPQRHVARVGEPQIVRIAGASPRVQAGYSFRTYSNSQDWMTNNVEFAFSVPQGGWGDTYSAPLYANYVGLNANNKKLGWRDVSAYNGGRIVFAVDPDSPAFRSGRRTRTQLVAWLAGLDEKSVEIRDTKNSQGTTVARTWYTYGWPSARTAPESAGEAPTGVAAEVLGLGATFLIFQ